MQINQSEATLGYNNEHIILDSQYILFYCFLSLYKTEGHTDQYLNELFIEYL